jgi:hypothetical protein
VNEEMDCERSARIGARANRDRYEQMPVLQQLNRSTAALRFEGASQNRSVQSTKRPMAE